MHRRQTLFTNRTFNSLQFGVFYGIFERLVYFLRFFVQLKWSGRVYMLTVVSGLMNVLGYHLALVTSWEKVLDLVHRDLSAAIVQPSCWCQLFLIFFIFCDGKRN